MLSYFCIMSFVLLLANLGLSMISVAIAVFMSCPLIDANCMLLSTFRNPIDLVLLRE